MGEAQGSGGIGRSSLAVIAGGVVGVVVVFVVESIGPVVYPPPPGMDFKNPEAVKAMMKNLPAGALLIVLLAWALGALAGGWVAARIAKRSHVVHALVVGALLLAGGVVNLVAIPHPLWFTVVSVLLFLPAAWAGARLAHRG